MLTTRVNDLQRTVAASAAGEETRGPPVTGRLVMDGGLG